MKYADDYKHLGKKTYDYFDYKELLDKKLKKKIYKSIKKFDSRLFHSLYDSTRRDLISIFRRYYLDKYPNSYHQGWSVSNFKDNQIVGFCKHLISLEDEYIDIKKYRILKIQYFENQ